MARMERKYLAHYIDANFNPNADANNVTLNYVRLGKDLEAYNEELNPQVEIRRNILGEQNVIHNGYQVQSTAEPYYADKTDPLFEPLAAIANDRKTGSGCQTTRLDVLYDASGSVIWAWREDCWVVPNAVGGDTSGVQLPFNVYNAGNRVPGVYTSGTFKKATITIPATLSVTSSTTAANRTLAPTIKLGGTTASTGTVKWRSSDTTIVTVANSTTSGSENSGIVTWVAAGTAVVTADFYGARASCIVTST